MVRILEEMEEYAALNNIPIMMPDGIEFLLEYIKEHHVKNILEIGSAIGYSSIRMASVDESIKVTTIERDEKRYAMALKNIHKAGLDNRIEIIAGDALETNIDSIYDLIFIDAAKAQYIKFFEKYKHNLSMDGAIVSDNLNFHGLVHEDTSTMSRNVRGLVRKINLYVDFLTNNDEFKTEFYSIGDGIGISTRK